LAAGIPYGPVDSESTRSTGAASSTGTDRTAINGKCWRSAMRVRHRT